MIKCFDGSSNYMGEKNPDPDLIFHLFIHLHINLFIRLFVYLSIHQLAWPFPNLPAKLKLI